MIWTVFYWVSYSWNFSEKPLHKLKNSEDWSLFVPIYSKAIYTHLLYASEKYTHYYSGFEIFLLL